MDDMNENADRGPTTEKGRVAPLTEASLRVQVTDLLLGGLRDVRTGGLTLEQGDVLQRIEAALEA
jgi:hypothetical protein